ncbi:MAG: helix-turn-helix domain containing protein [Candidatus Sulfopaludibacter sp.]|nr:helix-turn-helix domain containing protein [Candidatus Sulfopaludibacter sp.]
MRKLLKAATEVLGQHGLEGATIPRIAQHAGLTPGAIYRRFSDKDALLETVIIGILQRQDERLRMMLTPAMARQIPLAVVVEQLINNMLVSYRANAGLMRALRQFAQGRDHTSFYRKVTRLEMRTYQYLVELFLVHREDVKHPDPQMAVSFALVMLISTLIELILVDHDMKNWQAVIPKDDLALQRELLRSFLSYLGIEHKNN